MRETLDTPPATEQDVQRATAAAFAAQVDRSERGLPFDPQLFEADVEAALAAIREQR